jgi:hypothetical protein
LKWSGAYAGHFLGGWDQYYEQLIQPFELFAREAEGLGVGVVRGLTLDAFSQVLTKGDVDVFILFSHWSDSYIELAGGPAHASAVVDAIPVRYTGFLDLCVCHPVALVEEVTRKRPRCLVRFSAIRAQPFVWLLYFAGLFRLLNTRTMNYLQAYDAMNTELAKYGGRE